LRDGRPRGTTLLDYAGEEPKPLNNEAVLDGIEQLLRRYRELRADVLRYFGKKGSARPWR
jgi:hypothetical protein